MEIYLQQNGQAVGPYTEEQLQESVAAGAINQFDLAFHEGINDWQPLCTIILIKIPPPKTSHAQSTMSGLPLLPPPPQTSGTPLLPPPDIMQTGTAGPGVLSKVFGLITQLGAVIAGWTCFLLGFTILVAFSWPFYFHYILFVAAVMFSIEALSQRRIIGGLSLLLTTLMLPVIAGFALLFHRANKAAEPVTEESGKTQVGQHGKGG